MTEVDEWRSLLTRFEQSDVYFTPEYHQVYELNGDGTAWAFAAWEEDWILFYPFMLREIPKPPNAAEENVLRDIESVYGYSGPLANCRETRFLNRAWQVYREWCWRQNVVAEFVRFHPILANHSLPGPWDEVTYLRETVAIELNCSTDELWQRYPSIQRNRIRKAYNTGLICREVALGDGLFRFIELYLQTMKRKKADDFYNFPLEYFYNLAAYLGNNLKLFGVFLKSKMIAAALFLLKRPWMHYHLGGSDEEHLSKAPNNLLFHTAAEWGRSMGYSLFHLGGGNTNAPDDPLLRFKSSFSKKRLPFHIGKRVHNQSAYERLCHDWLNRHGLTERPKYFLLYRYNSPSRMS